MLKDRMADGQSLEDTAAAFVKEHRPSSIIQRAASVEEVANIIVYVCSPQASAGNARRWRRRRHHRLICPYALMAGKEISGRDCVPAEYRQRMRLPCASPL